MTVFNRRTLFALATIALMPSILPGFAAQTAQSLADRVRDANAISEVTNLEVLLLPDETIVSATVQANGADDLVRKEAGAIARLVGSDEALRDKPLKVVLVDQSNALRSVTVPVAMLTTGSLGSIAVSSGQKAWANKSAAAGAPAVAAASPGFQSERGKLVSRIKALQAKGVGVQPYFGLVSQIDEVYSHGDVSQAEGMMGKLSETIGEQEKVIHDRQTAVAAAKRAPAVAANYPTAAVPAGNYTPAQQRMISRMRTDGATESQIKDALGSFNGTSDQYYDEIARTMLQHELGDLAPCEGPFRMERFRIAKKIQELRNGGQPVDSFVQGYRKLEEMAAEGNKDPRQLPAIADNVRYMEKNLGLTALQGGSHRQAQ